MAGRELVVMVLAGSALGCAERTFEPAFECGRGSRVEREGRVYCVYVGETLESYECPPGLDVRVQTSGAIVCSEAALPSDVCSELGIDCPSSSLCPESASFDGHDPDVVEAFDGRRSQVVSSLVLHEQEQYSSGYGSLYVDGDRLLWPHTNDRCGRRPHLGWSDVWWGWQVTSVALAADGSPSAPESVCVPNTFSLHSMETARRDAIVFGCGAGHHPVFFVSCGVLGRDRYTRSLGRGGAHEYRVGMSAGGFLVYAADQDPPVAALVRFDVDGFEVASREIPRLPGLQQIVRVEDEWWLLESLTEPLPTVRVHPISDALAPAEPFELAIPHRSAQRLSLRAARAELASAAHVLVASAAPDEPARLTYALIRHDRTFATRTILRETDEQDIAFMDVRLGDRGLSALATSTAGATGVRTTRLLRIDCDGRRLEPPLVIGEAELLGGRALEVSRDMAWAITSRGTNEPGFENVLHTIHTE